MESPTPPSRGAPGPLSSTAGPLGHKDIPLRVSDLLTQIGQHMDRTTLFSCLLVCQEWHKLLKPLIWTDLRLFQTYRQFKEPMTDELIRQHAPKIQRLSIRVARSMYWQILEENQSSELCLRSIDFPKLRSLEIDINQKDYLNRRTKEMEVLTTSLFRLMLESSSRLNGGGEGLRMLQVLKIESFHFQCVSRHWTTLWETLWSRLQVLSLVGTWCEGDRVSEEEENTVYADGLPPVIFSRLFEPTEMKELAERLGPSLTMKDLTLVDDSMCANQTLFEIQRWMVLQCPKLVRLEWCLEWPAEEETSSMMLIRDTIKFARLSKSDPVPFQDLQTVALPGPFDEMGFFHLIQTMSCLKELNLRHMDTFTDSSWKVLVAVAPHHLETLRVLNVQGCDLGSMTIDILCNLPQLESFQGDIIFDTHLREDTRPWACKGTLKYLNVEFRVTSQRRLLSQTMIVSRLAELEQLEDLILNESNLRLDLSKPKGLLEGLRSLRRLKTFALETRQHSIDCYWGLDEMAWVRENWPRLKYVDNVRYKDEVRSDNHFPSIPYCL